MAPSRHAAHYWQQKTAIQSKNYVLRQRQSEAEVRPFYCWVVQ
jgi:hypothetical protein